MATTVAGGAIIGYNLYNYGKDILNWFKSERDLFWEKIKDAYLGTYKTKGGEDY